MAKKRQAKKAPAFPDVIYVKREPDEDNPYLVAEETMDAFDHGEQVAVYERRAVKTVTVTKALA